MAHPAVRFRLTHNKKTVLDLPASMSMTERTFQIYGAEVAENVIEFSGEREPVRLTGLIGRPGYTRSDKTYQDFYVNHRAIRNLSLSHALYSACGDMLMRDRHPVAFIFIELDPALVDVNVHPAKAEVRFRNQSQIHDLVRDVIRDELRLRGTAPTRERDNARPEEVREAFASYLQSQAAPGAGTEASRHSLFFGRRKRDTDSIPLSAGALAPQPLTGMPGIEMLYPLAQVHDSFILAQSRDGMAIIDQHAAHERVLFEKLQDQFGAGEVPVQDLLVPDHVELGPAQGGLLKEYLPELAKVGLVVEDFGNGTFMIKAVPSLLAGTDYRKLLLDILDEVNVHGRSGKIERLRDEVLSVMACHPAIKVHRRLGQREMESLLLDLSRCRMPHTCPHGRPTIVRYSIDEIKRMFKRI